MATARGLLNRVDPIGRCPTCLDNSGGIPLRGGILIVLRDYTMIFRAMQRANLIIEV